MLSGSHFYYQLTRKYVVIFGNIFNNISLIRKDKDTGKEIDRIKVPIIYGPKERYVTRIEQDPDLQKEVAITLPRMSYEITGMNYDAARKQNSLLRQAKDNTATRVKSQYMGVPYDFSFELSIYSKNIDDANHILEQILPYFNPDYTVSIIPIPEMSYIKDVPIVLDTVSTSTQYEGNYDNVRYVTTNLTFTMKGYFWGPVADPKLIRKVIANIYNEGGMQSAYISRINTTSGNAGKFIIDDIVYQGANYNSARAYGSVLEWEATDGKLMLGSVQGQFKVGEQIRGLSSNAVYSIASFDISPLKLAKITIEPDPINANTNSDYGYTTVIQEFPNIDE